MARETQAKAKGERCEQDLGFFNRHGESCVGPIMARENLLIIYAVFRDHFGRSTTKRIYLYAYLFAAFKCTNPWIADLLAAGSGLLIRLIGR